MSETQSKIKKLIDRKKLLNKENIFNILLIIIIFLADRLSKNKIISIFSTQEISVYINNFLNLATLYLCRQIDSQST